MDLLNIQFNMLEDVLLQLFVGPNNAIAASIIIIIGMTIMMVVDNIDSNDKL